MSEWVPGSQRKLLKIGPLKQGVIREDVVAEGAAKAVAEEDVPRAPSQMERLWECQNAELRCRGRYGQLLVLTWDSIMIPRGRAQLTLLLLVDKSRGNIATADGTPS
jgi:hypothetical protein